MSQPFSKILLAVLNLTLAGLAMTSFAASADDGDTRAPPSPPSYGMQPMQVMVPPMWQPHPPAWYRPDLMWRQHQPESMQKSEDEDNHPARSHWQRHAPEWMNLPPQSSRTTSWKPQSLSPSAVDSVVNPVSVPPPEDALSTH